MNRDQLAEQLDRIRERLLVAIDPLPDEALLQPQTLGDWSVADTLAHLAVWEAELVTGLMKLREGKKPGRLLAALANRPAYNHRRYEENRARDLDRIFDDLFRVRAQLERWLDRFRDSDLTRPGRYTVLGRDPLWRLVASASFEHEAAHLPALEALSQSWLNAADEPAPTTISLAEIEVSSHDNGT